MTNGYYDRYKPFRIDGEIVKIPQLEIDADEKDLFIAFDRSKMRLDSLSYKYYGDANYGWLILMSNPQYGSMEFEIPDNVTLRIPYPIQSALNRYERAVNAYFATN